MKIEGTPQQDLNDMNLNGKIVLINKGPGERLANAREQANLTISEVAEQLYLTPSVIQAIENDQYPSSINTVFLRGYLRSYAKLLNLPPDEIVQTFDSLGMKDKDAEIPTHVLHKKTFSFSDQFLPWITGVVALILIVLVFTWWHSQNADSTDVAAVPQPPKAKVNHHPTKNMGTPQSNTNSVQPNAAAVPAAPAASVPPSNGIPSSNPNSNGGATNQNNFQSNTGQPGNYSNGNQQPGNNASSNPQSNQPQSNQQNNNGQMNNQQQLNNNDSNTQNQDTPPRRHHIRHHNENYDDPNYYDSRDNGDDYNSGDQTKNNTKATNQQTNTASNGTNNVATVESKKVSENTVNSPLKVEETSDTIIEHPITTHKKIKQAAKKEASKDTIKPPFE
jgi:cytoskeletal protein RodZ